MLCKQALLVYLMLMGGTIGSNLAGAILSVKKALLGQLTVSSFIYSK